MTGTDVGTIPAVNRTTVIDRTSVETQHCRVFARRQADNAKYGLIGDRSLSPVARISQNDFTNGTPVADLFDRINEAEKQHYLPTEMCSYLHNIRILSNKADHDAEAVILLSLDAENSLNNFLRVVEWFFCECEQGQRLPSIYKDVEDSLS